MYGGYHHLLPATTTLASICGFIYIYLTWQVVKLRGKYKQAVGAIDNDEYARKNGVHGNFASATPLFLIIFAMSELLRVNCGIMFFLGGLFILARIAHIYSLYSYEKKTGRYSLRIFGMVATFGLILALGLTNLYILYIN